MKIERDIIVLLPFIILIKEEKFKKTLKALFLGCFLLCEDYRLPPRRNPPLRLCVGRVEGLLNCLGFEDDLFPDVLGAKVI